MPPARAAVQHVHSSILRTFGQRSEGRMRACLGACEFEYADGACVQWCLRDMQPICEKQCCSRQWGSPPSCLCGLVSPGTQFHGAWSGYGATLSNGATAHKVLETSSRNRGGRTRRLCTWPVVCVTMGLHARGCTRMGG